MLQVQMYAIARLVGFIGLFQSLGLRREAYDKVDTNMFPLPIPEDRNDIPRGELRYLTLEDTMKLSFTYDHQPSEQARGATS